MLLIRSRTVGLRMATLLHSSLIETGPRVSAVSLLHTVNYTNNKLRLLPQVEWVAQHPAWRSMATGGHVPRKPSPTEEQIVARVMAVCKAFDKISADKLALDSHFIKDLGLDSLDHVEVIMAIEDEFGFEIPDEHAEKLITPEAIAKYVSDHEDSTVAHG